jgi:hypothetical protein
MCWRGFPFDVGYLDITTDTAIALSTLRSYSVHVTRAKWQSSFHRGICGYLSDIALYSL